MICPTQHSPTLNESWGPMGYEFGHTFFQGYLCSLKSSLHSHFNHLIFFFLSRNDQVMAKILTLAIQEIQPTKMPRINDLPHFFHKFPTNSTQTLKPTSKPLYSPETSSKTHLKPEPRVLPTHHSTNLRLG